MRIESADLVEQRLANHQAGARDRGNFARANETAGITIHVPGEPAHGMVGGASHPEGYARMLDGLVLVSEQGPRGPYVRLLAVVREVFEPIAADYFSVVVKENEKLTRGGGSAFIVGARKRLNRPGKGDSPGGSENFSISSSAIGSDVSLSMTITSKFG